MRGNSCRELSGMGWSRSSLPFNFLPFVFLLGLLQSETIKRKCDMRNVALHWIWMWMQSVVPGQEPKDNYAHKGANQPRPTQIKKHNKRQGGMKSAQKKVQQQQQQQGQGQGQGQELGKSSVRILQRRSWIRDQDYATDFSGIQEKQHHDIIVLRKTKLKNFN